MSKSDRENSVTRTLRLLRVLDAFANARAEELGLSRNAYHVRLIEEDRNKAPLPTPAKKRGIAVSDQKALAAVLASFGQTRLSPNIKEIADLAKAGALPVTVELEALLRDCTFYLRAIYHLLLKALGQKPEDRP